MSAESTAEIGATLYVNTSHGDDSAGDGSQLAPFASIQRALEAASSAGGTVEVAPGQYTVQKKG